MTPRPRRRSPTAPPAQHAWTRGDATAAEQQRARGVGRGGRRGVAAREGRAREPGERIDVGPGPVDERLHDVGDHVLPADDEHEEHEHRAHRRRGGTRAAPTATATATMTTRAPELRDRPQDRRREVGRVRRAPRREAVVDACEPGVFAHHPEQHADCDRAGDDDSGRRPSATNPVASCGSTRRAHERAQLRMGFDFVADDRTRGARATRDLQRASAGRPRRPATPATRATTSRTRTTTYERFANRSIGETRTHANPVDGRGRRGGGLAANPSRSRLGNCDARAARSLRPTTRRRRRAARRVARASPSGRRGRDRDSCGLRRAHHGDGRARLVPHEDRLRRIFRMGCRGQPVVRPPARHDLERSHARTARRSPTRSP